jgi:hypothetical protein
MLMYIPPGLARYSHTKWASEASICGPAAGRYPLGTSSVRSLYQLPVVPIRMLLPQDSDAVSVVAGTKFPN